MGTLFCSKSCKGSYYLRDRPGGRGTALGHVWTANMGPAAGSFYNAMFDTEEAHINFTERGQPRTVIAMLEERLKARFPEATFERENFK